MREKRLEVRDIGGWFDYWITSTAMVPSVAKVTGIKAYLRQD
jgi:hypothetical protein